MKKTFLFTVLILCSTLLSAQKNISIDYQYQREKDIYYAFELLITESFDADGQLHINFTVNKAFNKVQKITLTSASSASKLEFESREGPVKSDNPELKHYPLSINWNDLDKKLDCETQITFKLDNGDVYTLPFDVCKIKEFLAKTKISF